MPKNFKTLLLSVVLASFIIPNMVSAVIGVADVAPVDNTVTTSACVTINSNLSYRNRRTNNQDDVNTLQDFLNTQGYLNDSSVTGFFGVLTAQAVASFQRDSGIPATPPGYVGASTRAMIEKLSCNGVNSADSLPTPSTTNQFAYNNVVATPVLPTVTQSLNVSGCSTINGVTVCTPQVSYNQTPTVEFVGTPTLGLQYEKGSESILVGKATVKIITGNSQVYVYPYSVASILGFNSNGVTYSNLNGIGFNATPISPTVPTSMPGTYLLPANSSSIFTIYNTAPARELFAGSYYLKPSGLSYLDSYSNNQTLQPTAFRNAPVSNSVTVIGETSPYINNVICDSTVRVNCTISGVRFDAASNYVNINGVNKTLSSFNGSSINFQVSDFNISQNGNYVVQVSTNNGASNNFAFNVGSLSNQAPNVSGNSVPTVEFTSVPTLSLQYDGSRKESALVGKVTAKITAGSLPVDISGFTHTLQLFVNGVITNPSNGTNYDAYSPTLVYNNIIPANTSATFNITVTAPTRELVPGSYTVGSSIQSVQPQMNAMQSSPVLIMGEVSRNVVNVPSSNSVTIIGETSPYINNVICDSTVRVNCTISGVRFDAASNYVNINGVNKTLSSFNGSSINFQVSDFNITQYGTYFVQVSTSNGASNNFSFQMNNLPVITPINIAACTPFGITLAGNSVDTLPYYDTATVVAPATCKGGLFTCTNGALYYTPTGGSKQPYSASVPYNQSCVVTPAPVTTAPAPTATFTVNGGQKSVTVKVGDTVTKTWSSTNGATYDAIWTASGTSCAYNGQSAHWTGIDGKNRSGDTESYPASVAQVGCTFTITYKVISASGQSVGSSINVTTEAVPAPVAPIVNIQPTPTAIPTCASPSDYYYYYAPDVKAAGVDALVHWNTYGYKEGRKSCWAAPALPVTAPVSSCGGLTPEAYYYSHNTDVRDNALYGQNSTTYPNNTGALEHWKAWGKAESRQNCWPAGVAVDNLKVKQYTVGGVAFDITAPATCKTLVPISKGSWDSNSNGSVSALQNFLAKKYNLNTSDVVTGYYGDMTVENVKRFQTENNLEAVGYVGQATRELIKSQCSN